MASKYSRKKTDAEANAYKKSVKRSPLKLEGTVDMRSANLVGSNEIGEQDVSDEGIREARLSLWTRIKRHIKEHAIETGLSIVVTVLIAVVSWSVTTLIDLKVDCAVFETKLGIISEQIKDLDTDDVTRELLDLQLDALRQELSYGREIDRVKIENRIDLIEQQIALIQGTVYQSTKK